MFNLKVSTLSLTLTTPSYLQTLSTLDYCKLVTVYTPESVNSTFTLGQPPSTSLLSKPNTRRYSRPCILPVDSDQLQPPDSPHDSPRHSPTTTSFKFEHRKYQFLRAQSEDQSTHSDDGRSICNPGARRESVSDFRPAYFGKSDDTYRRSLHGPCPFLSYFCDLGLNCQAS